MTRTTIIRSDRMDGSPPYSFLIWIDEPDNEIQLEPYHHPRRAAVDITELDQALAGAKARFDHADAPHEPDVLALIRAAESMRDELVDTRHLFELQWTRSREADAAWRAEDPAARALVMPDLGVLLAWLMAKAGLVGHTLAELRPVPKMDAPNGLFKGICSCGKDTATGSKNDARKAWQAHADAKNAEQVRPA